MKILSIETSCDETAIALVEVDISDSHIKAIPIQTELFSQIDIHKEFGGVFPIVAKREHAVHLPILLEKILKNHESSKQVQNDTWEEIQKILEREQGLFEKTKILLEKYSAPDIDMIAVTQGPGLEPALWVGISFAKALSLYWNIPLIGTNHMKGHIFSVLLNQAHIEFPSLALLISGGHTELVEMNSISDFTIIGQTRDDAIGESYDKVARMIGLEYPGGPKIENLAKKGFADKYDLPKPLFGMKEHNCNFSFCLSTI